MLTFKQTSSTLLSLFSAVRATQLGDDRVSWETFIPGVTKLNTPRGIATVQGVAVSYTLDHERTAYELRRAQGKPRGKPQHYTQPLADLTMVPISTK